MAWGVWSQGRLATAKGCRLEKNIFGRVFRRSAMRFRYRSIGKHGFKLALEAAHKLLHNEGTETSRTEAGFHDNSAETTPSRGDRRRRFWRTGSHLRSGRRAGQDHARRPPQPPFVPAAALSSRDRLAGDLRDRLADPLS